MTTPELIRQLRVEERRDPVEAAFWALLCLSEDHVSELSARLNLHNEDRPYARRVYVHQELRT